MLMQVLTLEDWNFVLYNCMASISPWSALFFVLMIIVGKNVILNILVGIVVENFQNQVRIRICYPTTAPNPLSESDYSNKNTLSFFCCSFI